LGLPDDGFVVLITGGGEGSGGIWRRAAALVRRVDGVTVVAVCGRNGGLRRRLDALAARSADRLVVKGFVDNMADWLRCADVVVGKAGPGTIAEATCAGTPLLLTSHVPGQERGNVRYVVMAGAGRYVPTVRQLVREVHGLRHNPSALAAMRSGSRRVCRPQAAADIATLLADLVSAARGGGGGAATAGSPPPVAAGNWSNATGGGTHAR
jgi:1,2-diacylglycerol 3-beta-galactosyltransferase